jgi:hypothetical protein
VVWLRRSRWLRVISGLVVGAVIGVLVYEASRLTGLSLFLLTGATAGGVAALLIHAYTKGGARLTDVSVTIPQFSELHFVLTRDTQQVAWRLFSQLSTRVATRPLASRAGLIREALSSLHALFLLTREIVEQVQPSARVGKEPTVEHLAVAMLNHEIEPFLSFWHAELGRWERASPDHSEDEWPRNGECRAELARLQNGLRPYLLGFGKLAGMSDATIETLIAGGLAPLSLAAPRQSSPPIASVIEAERAAGEARQFDQNPS